MTDQQPAQPLACPAYPSYQAYQAPAPYGTIRTVKLDVLGTDEVTVAVASYDHYIPIGQTYVRFEAKGSATADRFSTYDAESGELLAAASALDKLARSMREHVLGKVADEAEAESVDEDALAQTIGGAAHSVPYLVQEVRLPGGERVHAWSNNRVVIYTKHGKQLHEFRGR
jgi:hypothetical protein